MLFRKYTFPGGIHPDDNKARTAGMKTERMPLPASVVIPMSMHIGAPASVLVKKGDIVAAGQVIGEAGGKISSSIHSSISGTVKAVGMYPHPMGGKVTAVEIERDARQEQVSLPPIFNWHETASETLIERISDAGIIGKGGASFPTAVKLSPPPADTIDTLIINAAECEPYLTTDHRLMIEFTEDLLQGIAIAKRILDVEHTYIGIEKNKLDAIRVISQAIKRNPELSFITLCELETKYPQGGEKQLITAITGREVPSGELPLKAGAVVLNSGTAKAIYDAVVTGKPLYERIVTVTGAGIQKPGNYIVPVGTRIQEILDHSKADFSKIRKIVLGGPMMGIAQPDLSAPVIKATAGILALHTLPEPVKSYTCINCGSCVQACPMGLVPSRFAKLVEADKFDELPEENIMDCIDCGCCTYSCPAKINIVHAIKLGKDRIKKQK
ncbi:MAG: electron transport complex subunit RsxC [Fibrobacterota bacterium]